MMKCAHFGPFLTFCHNLFCRKRMNNPVSGACARGGYFRLEVSSFGGGGGMQAGVARVFWFLLLVAGMGKDF